MTKNEELKPCPFCGGAADEAWDFKENTSWATAYIQCKDCGAKGERFDYLGNGDAEFEKATQAWNTRPEPQVSELPYNNCNGCKSETGTHTCPPQVSDAEALEAAQWMHDRLSDWLVDEAEADEKLETIRAALARPKAEVDVENKRLRENLQYLWKAVERAKWQPEIFGNLENAINNMACYPDAPWNCEDDFWDWDTSHKGYDAEIKEYSRTCKQNTTVDVEGLKE